MIVLQFCMRVSGDQLLSELLSEGDIVEVNEGTIPSGVNFRQLSDEADEKYFDAEDSGNFDDAISYFYFARLMAGLALASSAVGKDEYSEASYEVLMSLPEPQSHVEPILQALEDNQPNALG